MRSPRLAALELKRFGRGRLPRAALVALLLLPLLYGALYLWSFWDPYGRLDRLPVALVNADEGATVEGERLRAGDDIAKKLLDSDTFEWHETSAADARAGVENGTYYLSLTMPADFSERIASSSGDDPRAGALQVRTNDANNYIVGSISRTVFSEVRAAASAKTSRGFYDKIFISFSDIHGQTEKAARSADRLGEGIGKAKKGAESLTSGLAEAKEGSSSLASGLTRLDKGAETLHTGAGGVAQGTQALADKVNGMAEKAGPFLKENGKEIGEMSRLVADASSTASRNLTELPETAATAATQARKASDTLAADYRKRCAAVPPAPRHPAPTDSPTPTPSEEPEEPGRPEKSEQPGEPEGSGDEPGEPEGSGAPGQHGPAPSAPTTGAPTGGAEPGAGPDCGALRKSAEAAATAAGVAEDLDRFVENNADGLSALGGHLDDLHDKALLLARSAPRLSSDLDTAVDNVNALNTAAHKVARGADGVHTGVSTAKDGATSVDSGVGTLHDGADTLDGGIFKLVDGSGKLSGKLHQGAARIPDHDKRDRQARSEVMADPVRLAAQSLHKAPNYGTGFAPYFIPLSLWVGAMVAYMLVQPLNRRALATGASAWRIALAGWLPVAAIGVAQAAALMAVLHWGLGLRLARAAGTIGFLVLVTACFAAIVQLLNAHFGPAGRILVLALLMLQLTSAGGTYPVQTSPGFFNAVHPFLPMSHVVVGLRRLITGGGLGPVWQGCAVLLAFTVGALVLTALSARRRQVWSVDRLHPELSL
ncbi:YhgE/Pip domain-containing protein [Streptomyces sp. LX-29]|uniref:YhgE/Pip domain-containing protein n=1 Tax=Streptomyces sp. LX-29 TaxID=2900152 RepID=UPI00240DC2A5|nr:YhgE/Pip domain-containing protein [Streptomyces sp. LX-29]WFB10016.1 YhgE/Pip domain-containing protein [Streptomyces sp. LX-29]